jgi:hypothetical protein
MAFIGNADTVKRSYVAGSTAKTTTSQYMACYISAADTVSVVNTTTAHPVGIIDSYQSAGSETVRVVVNGLAKAYANASVAAGSLVTCVDGGKVATAGATITAYILGRAESNASTNGAITIFVNPMGI